MPLSKGSSKLSKSIKSLAFSLIEALIAMAILGIALTFGISTYRQHLEKTEIVEAIADIKLISVQLTDYQLTYGEFPESLASINLNMNDPWGNPYQYLPIAGNENLSGRGQLRKDKNLVPINSDFDLYSMGKDGRSVGPLTARHSRDDIVRANNGRFVGKAEDY